MEGLSCLRVRQGHGEPVTHWLGPAYNAFFFLYFFFFFLNSLSKLCAFKDEESSLKTFLGFHF